MIPIRTFGWYMTGAHLWV